ASGAGGSTFSRPPVGPRPSSPSDAGVLRGRERVSYATTDGPVPHHRVAVGSGRDIGRAVIRHIVWVRRPERVVVPIVAAPIVSADAGPHERMAGSAAEAAETLVGGRRIAAAHDIIHPVDASGVMA